MDLVLIEAEITATVHRVRLAGFEHSRRPRRNITIHNRQRTAMPDDISLVSQLILHERQGRDRGWWHQMHDTFASDAQVRLSWFRGSGADFVAESRKMTDRGDISVHRLSPATVHIHGDRAFVEISTGIEMRAEVNGVLADLVSYARLLYRAEKRDGSWKIISLDPIYERDTLAPAVPGADLRIDPQHLEHFRTPYQMLAYHLSERGYSINDDLYGDDRPEEAKKVYADIWRWLGH